ncbi:MAG: histidine phosphatase family protein [Lachnospiraceae bacterium]|nr:histidine phosphatase family protein [Lachnospiraceae bacterium]
MRKIYIVRHGETDWNNAGRLQGWTDMPLNANGVELASITGKGLSDVHFDLAFSSPLIRAYQTGELVLKENRAGSVPDIIKDDRIKEIGFGKWEGLCCRKDNFEINDEKFWDFYNDPFGFEGGPGGESISAVCVRTGDFLQELINKAEYEGKCIAVFTHGCAVRAMLRVVYDKNDTFWRGQTPPNCCVNIIEAENGEARLTADDLVLYDPSLVRDMYMS